MNSDVNELARAVLKKPLEECSVDELQQVAEQYPYFGPIQLLLAKKISATGGQPDDSTYEEQVQKASLYFQNRVWLHHLLGKNGDQNSLRAESMVTGKETVVNEGQDKPEEFVVNKNIESEVMDEPVKEETTEQTPIEMPPTNIESGEQFVTDETNEEPLHSVPEIIPIEQPALSVEMPAINIESGEQVATDETSDEPLHSVPEIIPTEQPGLSVEMPALKIEPIPTSAGLIFEPYHTVDYFASQGIKFREEEKPKDRFSMQLKSFTEWLKTLKQTTGAELATNTDTSSEKKVEQMAEYSIAERHVITEAMAEVWKKQGNKGKAEEIYRKLSLLDPPKSAYFAAKIEELKKPS